MEQFTAGRNVNLAGQGVWSQSGRGWKCGGSTVAYCPEPGSCWQRLAGSFKIIAMAMAAHPARSVAGLAHYDVRRHRGDVFWQRHLNNTGQTREQAIEMLRKLLGDRWQGVTLEETETAFTEASAE